MSFLQRSSLRAELPFRQERAPKQKTVAYGAATTPVSIDNLRTALAHHPDRLFVHTLLDGLSWGFDTGILELPTNSICCNNLQSARGDPEAIASLIDKELDKGFLLGPFEVIPYTTFRINPIGLAEHKYSAKKRLIVDLSAPHNDPKNPSLNSLIHKDSYSLKYVTIDDAIKVIKRLGKGALLFKTDIADAFKLVPIKPDLWPFHGIAWDNKFYFYIRLVFGSRSSPKIFDTLSEAICWIAKHNVGIDNLLHLLDDFLVVDSPLADGQETMQRFLAIFHTLNIPLALHKTEGPCTELEYLGVCLDSVNMEARLPLQKIVRIKSILEAFSHRKTCTKRELLSLLGHMNFASRVIRPGRAFVSHLISLSTTVTESHYHVTLTSAVRSDLAMWAP